MGKAALPSERHIGLILWCRLVSDADVKLFTDGACLGNPGPGGWAAILKWNGHEKELSGGLDHTTNNQMELQAAISGLQALKRPMNVTITTDSK